MAKMNYSGNVVDTPPWLAAKLEDDSLLRYPAKLNTTGFINQLGILVNVTGTVATDATSIPVTALAPMYNSPVPLVALGRVLIPAGTVLDFGGKKYVRTTADAKQGDTSIAVSAVGVALAANDKTYWKWDLRTYIFSGVLLGRTLAERDAGTGFGIADTTNDEEFGILMFDLNDAYNNNDIELLAPSKMTEIYENWLPTYSTVLRPSGTDNATMTKLRALYRCIVGIP